MRHSRYRLAIEIVYSKAILSQRARAPGVPAPASKFGGVAKFAILTVQLVVINSAEYVVRQCQLEYSIVNAVEDQGGRLAERLFKRQKIVC